MAIVIVSVTDVCMTQPTLQSRPCAETVDTASAINPQNNVPVRRLPMAIHPAYADHLPYGDIHRRPQKVAAQTPFILQARSDIAVFLRIEHQSSGR
jgi:hypothetical protein